MYLLIILSLALSSNLDNIGVGLAYGTRKVRLPFLSNLIVAVITSCGTLITMLLGKDMAIHYLNGTLANYLRVRHHHYRRHLHYYPILLVADSRLSCRIHARNRSPDLGDPTRTICAGCVNWCV